MSKEHDLLETQIENMLQNKQYSEAYELIQKKLEVEGTNPSLLVLMGRVTYALKEYSKAYHYFKQAKYFDEKSQAAAAGILRVSIEIPTSESQKDLFEIVKGYDHKDGYLARKDYYLGLNNIKDAVKEMKTASTKFALDEDVILAYISVLMKNNVDDPQIEGLIAKAKKLSDDVEILELEILYLYKACRYDECGKTCKKIVRRYPNSDVSQTARELVNKIKINREKEARAKADEYVPMEHNAESGPKVKQRKFNAQNSGMSAEDAERKLESLIGLDSVKQEIFKIKKKIEFDNSRREMLGLDYEDQDTYHFVFSGNPGTGKTTVARLLADILHGVGLLEKGQLVEVERGDLVGEYQGHTAKKTKKVIEEALGGVLFIDEAYGLINGDYDEFGREAIDALVKGVEDHRNEFVVILAGYREEMRELISTNVGLESRFTKFIDFPDYTEEELLEIAKLMASEQHYKFSADGELAFKEKITKKKVNKKFGNARTVRTLMSDAYAEKAINFDSNETSIDYMTILTPADFGIDLCKDSAQKAKDAIAKLDKLTGLKDVKYEIKSTVKMVDYLKQEREEGNIDNINITNNLHMCFAGNPGTGKTTVARIYAEVLAALGVSKTGELIEASRSDLVGRYQGETALKTKEICEKSYGGVLFIDEAYDLVQGENDSFGREAVATLIKQMEDNRDKMIVIFAGYSKEMELFMESNSGIKSRISKTIVFPDYSLDDLCDIFLGFVEEKKIVIEESADQKIYELIQKVYRARDEKFGNAREMRNLFETIWKNMVNRVETEHLEGDARRTFTVEDIINVEA